jgi:CDP-diacylglycerol--glycerol-3-phosphate 3-phosphatidyltransferase
MKHIASLISAGRIAGAFALFLTEPLSTPFFVLYALCCASDFLDGYIARKTNTASKFGETLDSIADFVLIAVMLVIFIPLISLEHWTLYWIAAIAAIRFASLAVGFVKYRAFALLHTYGNKATGIALACFPFFHQLAGPAITVYILCAAATLSALEELAINISQKELNRNRKSIL